MIDFRTNISLGRFIRNNKFKTKKLRKAGMYKLKNGSYARVYIGQIRLIFKERIKNHRDIFRKKDQQSNYIYHVIVNSHSFR